MSANLNIKTTSGNLRKHKMRKHVGEKPHSCKQYDYTSTFSNALQIHIMMNTGKKPLFDQCDYFYAQAHKLKKKHKMTHTGEKAHKFDQLKIKMRTQTGEEPYRFIQCDYTCTPVANLHMHMLTHTEVRPFNCNQCMKTFTQKSYLIKHSLPRLRCMNSEHKEVHF